MKIINIILSIIAAVFIIHVAGRIFHSFRFNQQVGDLLSQTESISDSTFSYDQLAGLPEPVQQYFRHVLPEGQPYISTVHLRHGGEFKANPDGDWVNIDGDQFFTARPPGFLWKGRTAMFTARDMFIDGHGEIVVTLFSLFNVMRGEGENYDESELLRWLGESVWFPTNLLPGEYISWSPIDSTTARLNFTYQDFDLEYTVYFNDANEITRLETERFMGEEGREQWIGKLSNYQEQHGMMIPMDIEGAWQLDSGEYSYARFQIQQIEYNITERD